MSAQIQADRAAKARSVQQQNAAVRAIDDPVQLARAARIVRAALARRRLTVADLTNDEIAATIPDTVAA